MRDSIFQAWIRFLQKKTQIISGLLWLSFGWASLLSHTPSDPSWNAVGGTEIQNWVGYPGAVFSDLIIQWVGLGGFVFVTLPFFWGLDASERKKRYRAGRWLMLGCLTIVTAGFMAVLLPGSAFYPLAGSGGILGHALRIVIMQSSQALPLTYVGLGLLMIALFRLAGFPRFFSSGSLAGDQKPGLCDRLDYWLEQKIARGSLALFLMPFKLVGETYARKKHAQHETEGFLPASPESEKEEFYEVREEAGNPPDAFSVEKNDMEGVSSRILPPPGDEMPARDQTFRPPPLSLLKSDEKMNVDREALMKARIPELEQALKNFGIRGRITGGRAGPVVSLFEFEPAPGVKASRIISLADDIALAMSAVSIRIAAVAGRNVLGIELPNETRMTVRLRNLLSALRPDFALPMALGRDIAGRPACVDLTSMPHLLIAGTTGAGKSVGVNAMILSLITQCSPRQCRFVMIDPKMLELSVYRDIPHLLAPVVTDPKKAVRALKWVVREMEQRYRKMADSHVRNMESFNRQAASEDKMPFIVVVIDEMADLMMIAGKEIEALVQRLAQMARASGIHIIAATQRPSVDVITGTIKANFPTRISYRVASKFDSRTILGEQGAETLLGRGDMLFLSPGGETVRLHGPFVEDNEVGGVCDFLRAHHDPDYVGDITEEEGEETGDIADLLAPGETRDELYQQAISLIMREGKVSTSFIQRHLQIGYNRAARIVDQMEQEGMISPASPTGKRDILTRAE